MTDPDAVARQLMQRAHLRDGLPEIGVGLCFLIVSGLVYGWAILPPGSAGFKAAAIAFVVLLSAFGLGTPSALRWIRRHYLIERVGCVQPRPIGQKHIATGLVGNLLMAAAILAIATRASRPDSWALAGTGVLGGALLAACGRVVRSVIFGVLMAATGIILALSGEPMDRGFAILFGPMGLLNLTSGTAVFVRFIRLPVSAGESS